MLIRLIILVYLNNTIQMITKNLHICHQYRKKPIILGLGTPYWIHRNLDLKRVLELVRLLFKEKSQASQPIGNDLGHPWKVCTFQSVPYDMHMHIP